MNKNSGSGEKEDKEEDKEENVGEETGENGDKEGDDVISINLPAPDASVAEAKPVGLAVAGDFLNYNNWCLDQNVIKYKNLIIKSSVLSK